jgi:hypothetical protein
MSTDVPRAARVVVMAVVAVGATASGAVAVGCAGTLEDPGRFLGEDGGAGPGMGTSAESGPSCGDLASTVFKPRCALGGCHSTASMSQGLDLESPDVLGRLEGKPARGGPGVLIDPGGDPSRSVLYLKLTPDPPFGTQMPAVGAKLDDPTMACVASWIETAGDGGHSTSSEGGAEAAEPDAPSEGASGAGADAGPESSTP